MQSQTLPTGKHEGVPMMGSKGSANGIECDAFSRRSRRMLSWNRGELRNVKRAFAKRARRMARLSIQKDQGAHRA